MTVLSKNDLQNKSTKVRAGMPSAKILGGKNDLKKKMPQNVSFLPEITVFDKTCQFLLENDDYLIKYVYFLKNKSIKVRGVRPSAKIHF